MDALGFLKFWRNAAGADTISDADDLSNPLYATDEEETDDEDSFFDLDFNSRDRVAVEELDADLNKDVHFIESPRDVLRSKNDRFTKAKPMSPVSVLQSAPMFKVFMLGFRKSSKCESNGELKTNQISKSSKLDHSSRFSFKCRAGDGPAAPVFTRDNSLRSKIMKEKFDYETASDVSSTEKSVPKYLKLMKPFYVNKTKSADSVTPSSSPVNLSPRKFSEGSRVGSFKIVTRNLGKSRSASAAVAVVPESIHRRDDSLLEQNDGIQGAILHCKKSFNSSSQEYEQLLRAASDPSHEKLRAPLRSSLEEQKRCSI